MKIAYTTYMRVPYDRILKCLKDSCRLYCSTWRLLVNVKQFLYAFYWMGRVFRYAGYTACN